MPTRNRVKFVALLVGMLISAYTIGVFLIELTPVGTTLRDVADIAVPFTLGYAWVWLSVDIAERSGWL